jgi:hypothetical protein
MRTKRLSKDEAVAEIRILALDFYSDLKFLGPAGKLHKEFIFEHDIREVLKRLKK